MFRNVHSSGFCNMQDDGNNGKCPSTLEWISSEILMTAYYIAMKVYESQLPRLNMDELQKGYHEKI